MRTLSAQPQVEVVRPPAGVSRGRWEAPAWCIGALGVTVLAAALAWTARRIVASRRARRSRVER